MKINDNEVKINPNIDSLYSYNEKIYVHSGFYAQRYGSIVSYNPKTQLYTIAIKLHDEDVYIELTTKQMRKRRSILGEMFKR